MKRIRAGKLRGYLIAGRFFTTKDAVLAELRRLMYSADLFAPIEGDDLAFLLGVLASHPRVDDKVGCGVLRMEVRPNPRFGGRGFWIVRTDGSETDWSYMKCLHPVRVEALVEEAARRAVELVIHSFKLATFATGDVRCPFTNQLLTPNTAHVDHIPPQTFRALLTSFLNDRGLAHADVELDGAQDGVICRLLADPELTAAWQAYHQQHARLRVVSIWANLSIIRRAASAA